jgi:hypothetical protein
MTARNFSKTADYFERRAAKAWRTQRREQLENVARLYRDKANRGEERNTCDAVRPAPSRRDRLAAMFRELGDPESIVRYCNSEQNRSKV